MIYIIILFAFIYSMLTINLFLHWFYDDKYTYFTKRGITGPTPIYILGNYLEQGTQNLIDLDLKWYNEYGKLYGYYNGMSPVLKISEPEHIKQILVTDLEKFDRKLRGNCENILINQSLPFVNGEQWKRIRSIKSQSISYSKFKKMFHLIEDSIKSMMGVLDNASKNKIEVDIKQIFSGFTMEVIASCGFSTKINAIENGNHPFLENAKIIFDIKIIKAIFVFMFPKIFNQMLGITCIFGEKGIEFFLKFVQGVYMDRKDKKNYHGDFFQNLIEIEYSKDIIDDKNISNNVEIFEQLDHDTNAIEFNPQNKTLTQDEIFAQALILFMVGYETTASALTWTAYELALNPEAQQRLYEEILTTVDINRDIDYDLLSRLPYLESIVMETLRLRPPITLMERVCTQDCMLGDTGIQLTKGLFVEIPIRAIHLSEDNFDHADKFIPDRFMPDNRNQIKPYTFIPFGGGQRVCVGMRFALMQIKIVIANLVLNYKVKKNIINHDPNISNLTHLNTPLSLFLKIEKRIN